MKIIVKRDSSLLEALQQLSPESSKNTLKSWIQQGRVSVNRTRVCQWKKAVFPGQEIKLGPRVGFAEEGIRILYEDRHLIVIDKPPQLLSVATATETQQTVHNILKKRFKKKVFPVHRLDKATSGVLVFAYTLEAQNHLKDQFMQHTIERVYYGLVEGRFELRQGTWRSYLAEDEDFFVKTSPQGKLAITHYEVIKHHKQCSLVKFTLETGRKNQIRVQAAESGHPILGDKKYGKTTTSISRLCLHAHILGFTHPSLNKRMQFISPLPLLFTDFR